MSETPKADGKFLAKVVMWAAVADVIWAVLIASLNSIFLSQAGTILGASAPATVAATILTWVITFFVALFQGAFFMVVIGGILATFAFILSGGFNKNRTQDKSDGADSDSAPKP